MKEETTREQLITKIAELEMMLILKNTKQTELEAFIDKMFIAHPEFFLSYGHHKPENLGIVAAALHRRADNLEGE